MTSKLRSKINFMAIRYARRRLGTRVSKRKRRQQKPRVVFRTTRARRKVRVYRRKAKTQTGKLWKYVKKATKSENKRFDAFLPSNPTYDVKKGGSLTSAAGGIGMPEDGRYLVVASVSSTYNSNIAGSFQTTDGVVTQLKGPNVMTNVAWRIDQYTTWGLHRGDRSYQAIGSEIFIKYFSLKLMLHIQLPDGWLKSNYSSQKFELWWIEEKLTDGVSNLTANQMMSELWDCTSSTYRASTGTNQVTGEFYVANAKPSLKLMQRINFSFRRKRLELNNRAVHAKRLYSITASEVIHQAWNVSGQLTNGSGNIGSIAVPLPSLQESLITKTFIIPVNRRVKLRDTPVDQRFLNYAFYLLPLDSTLTAVNQPSFEIFRPYMTCECVFTDK